MVKLARRFVALGDGLEIAWVLLDWAVGVAIEVGGDRGELCLERRKLLLRALQVPTRRVEGRLRRDLRAQQLLLTAEFGP